MWALFVVAVGAAVAHGTQPRFEFPGGFVPLGSGYPQYGRGEVGGSIPANVAVAGTVPACSKKLVQDSVYCNMYHSCPDDKKRYRCSEESAFNEATQRCDFKHREILCLYKKFKQENSFKVPNSIILSIRSDDVIQENSATCSKLFVQDEGYCNMYRRCPDDGKNYLCLHGTVFIEDQQKCDYDNKNLYCSGKQMKFDFLYQTSNSVRLGGSHPNFRGLQPFIQPLTTFHQQKPFAFSRPQQQPFTFNRQN